MINFNRSFLVRASGIAVINPRAELVVTLGAILDSLGVRKLTAIIRQDNRKQLSKQASPQYLVKAIEYINYRLKPRLLPMLSGLSAAVTFGWSAGFHFIITLWRRTVIRTDVDRKTKISQSPTLQVVEKQYDEPPSNEAKNDTKPETINA